MMTQSGTRDRIVAAADDLFYRKGFEATSFADIAEAVKISRGNFYYHFKTKDEILDTVIEKRFADREVMLTGWEVAGKSPQACIENFINILINNQSKIMLYGCPVGTLNSELVKLDHSAKERANSILMLFRAWLKRQFIAAGCEELSDQYAMHVLVWSQGVATLANAFKDEVFVNVEVQLVNHWVQDKINSHASE